MPEPDRPIPSLRLARMEEADAIDALMKASARDLFPGWYSAEQIQASLDSVKVDMTPELRAQISALSRSPGIATDRTDELKPASA